MCRSQLVSEFQTLRWAIDTTRFLFQMAVNLLAVYPYAHRFDLQGVLTPEMFYILVNGAEKIHPE